MRILDDDSAVGEAEYPCHPLDGSQGGADSARCDGSRDAVRGRGVRARDAAEEVQLPIPEGVVCLGIVRVEGDGAVGGVQHLSDQ